MERLHQQPILMITAFFTLLAILIPVHSECVSPTASYLDETLTPVYPPSPAPSPDPLSGAESPASSPDPLVEPESPAPSPEPSTGANESPDGSSSIPSALGLLSKAASNLNPFHKKEDPGIQDICSKTDYPPLCQSAVGSLLTSAKPDPVSVLQIAIKASAEKTKAAMGTMGIQSGSMNDCKDMYDDAVSNLEQAAEALRSHDMGTVNSMLSAAITDYSTCSDGFAETGGPNPLADLGDKLMKMASNCLAIASLIKG